MTTAILTASTKTAPQGPVVVDVGLLFREHAPFLLRTVERLTGRGGHVEDIVQDVFVVAHRRRAELRDAPEVRGWLYRVASHRAAQHRRSFWRRFRLKDALEAEPVPAHVVPEAVVQRRQQGEQIRKTLLELPFELREVFVLHDLEGLTAPSIAALLDIPEGTVWSRMSAARKEFRTAWTRSQGKELP